jgi:hypothetical protein
LRGLTVSLSSAAKSKNAARTREEPGAALRLEGKPSRFIRNERKVAERMVKESGCSRNDQHTLKR